MLKYDFPTEEQPFAVRLWGSRPGTDDDCWCGGEYDTLAEARAVFTQPTTDFSARNFGGGNELWIQLVGPEGEIEARQLQKESEAYRRQCDAEDRAARREYAMELGMALGVDAYNDAMGYGHYGECYR